MLEKDNSDGDIDAYCYEYDNVNNHHMAYDVDNMVKDYGQGYYHLHCDWPIYIEKLIAVSRANWNGQKLSDVSEVNKFCRHWQPQLQLQGQTL